tara:strand:+ start:66 stop:236 length:171 start_codon:yes stop_codon:yes gene_type:complete
MVGQPLTTSIQAAAAAAIMVVALVLKQAVVAVVVTRTLRYVATLSILKAHKLAQEP